MCPASSPGWSGALRQSAVIVFADATWPEASAESIFGQTEIQNLGMAALSDEDVGRLDVAMDDALGCAASNASAISMRNGQQRFVVQRPCRDQMLQRHAVKKLHGNERPAVLLADFVDRADIGMIERRRGLGLALKAV